MIDESTELVNKLILEHFNGKADEEIAKFLNSSKFSDIYANVMKKVFTEMADNMTEYFEKTMYEEVLESKYLTNEFLARHEQKWGKGFIAFEAMYILSIEAVKKYCEYTDTLQGKEKRQYTYLSLKLIHGRVCQQFLEILCLMQNGFADGAYARWRSMYELSVVADFILKNGEKVAESFCKNSDADDTWHNWAKAADCFVNQKGNISFSKIQEKCYFLTDIWKRQYALANKIVHASPQGTFGRLGIRKQSTSNFISVGRSDYGIAVPAEHSAITLAITTKLFLSIFPHGDSIIAMNYIDKWIDVVRRYFYQTEKECFSDNTEPIIKSL